MGLQIDCCCEHYDNEYCESIICSKVLHDEKHRKHEIRYGKSENFLVDE